MQKKRAEKKITLEALFKDILVCKKSGQRPYMEIFVNKPENVQEQKLGTLSGILEINDELEDSSYIVNYLISVIKKEYYSKTNRGTIESFEAALHRANLALAKLAEHGNIGWIGKINAIILVVEKNNIHLAQTGNNHALLLRSKVLTDICDGASALTDQNPLKTFTDVLSGRIEKGDKLILTTDSIFDIFSFDEIKRSAIKFSFLDLVQFFNTALVNELEKAAVLVAEIKEKVEEAPQAASSKKAINAWSQASFATAVKKTPPNRAAEKDIEPEEKKAIVSQIENEMERNKNEFVDKKTGHIYIKEDYFLQEKNSFLENLLESVKLKLRNYFSKIPKKISNLKQIHFSFKNPGPAMEESERLEEKEESISENPEIASVEPPTETPPEKISSFSIWHEKITKKLEKYHAVGIEAFHQKTDKKTIKNISAKIKSACLNALPRISRLKNIFSRFSYEQKIYAAGAVILILIVPYFIAKLRGETETQPEIKTEIAVAPEPLKDDKNLVKISEINQVYSGSGINNLINLNNRILAVSENSIVDLSENDTAYSLPENFSVKTASGMNDLNLILLLNNQNGILSWSAVSKKYQENAIIIPEGAEIPAAKSYLTYLYVLDKKNNQIYRYPRAEGGFGASTNWLKETADLSAVKDMAVSENIYLAENNNIVKFYRGKKQDFSIEETATAIAIDKIYTQEDFQYIYILDKINSRIVKLDLNGGIISQYYNSEISSAENLTTDEETSTAYFSLGGNVKSFKME